MTNEKSTVVLPVESFAELEYVHAAEENGISAYDLGEEVILRLRLSRSLGVTSCHAVIFDEYLNEKLSEIDGSLLGFDLGMDSFIFDLTAISNKASLRFFYIKIVSGNEIYYVKKGECAFVTDSPSEGYMFQLTVSDFKYKKPESFYGGIIYHIFVDRFNRGREVPVSDGAVLVEGEWEKIPEYPEYPGAPLKNNTFYGGTLYGVIDKLDYLESLGVNIIYLSPIFSSVSNHKYDTADYMTVDEMFGGEDALLFLIRETKKRGMKIILDGVFNHTGDDSIYFNRYSRFDSLGAYNSKKSPYYKWFDFQNHPNKYTCWWDIPILPRINPDIPECGDFIAGEGGVLEKYSNMGIYGFRLDVADELSDNFLCKIKERLSNNGESVVIGEVWEDASNKVAYGVRKSYYQGAELDGVMNYPVRVGIIDYLINHNSEKLRYALTDVLSNMPKRIRNAQMNLIGSHDTVRTITALSGVSAEGKSNAEKREMRLSPKEHKMAAELLKSAYTVLATLPGVPSIFYGDEAGLEGYGDPFCRMPYPWGKEDTNILSHYQKVGKIRRENEVFREGEFELLYLTDDLLVFSRNDKKTSLITVLNNSEKSKKFDFNTSVTNMFTGKQIKQLSLKKHSSIILKIDNFEFFELISEG